MKYRHNLDLVRMYIPDGTLHCAVHGRLEGDEATDVFHRLPFAADEMATVDAAIRTDPILRLRAAVHHWLSRFQRPKCEPIS